MKSKILIFLILLNIGCSSKHDQKEKPANIQAEQAFFTINIPELREKQREVPISEIADTIEYIPLQTSPESLLGSIKDIQFTKDYIFIDQYKRPLAQFDRTGNFIRNVSQLGRGPEEYVVMRRFSINEEHRRIYILSNYIGRIQVYSFEGEYIKSFRFPQSYGVLTTV